MPTPAAGKPGASDGGAVAVEAAEMGDEMITATPDKIPTKEASGSGLTDAVKLDAWDDVARLRAAEGDDAVNLDEGSDIQRNFSDIVATRTKEELRDAGPSGSGGSSAATTTVRDLERSKYSGPATDYDKVEQYKVPAKEFAKGDEAFKVVDLKETPLQGRATFNKEKGIQYKSSVKEDPAAFREDVKGLLEGTVPEWDKMGDEQREKMYGYIMREAKDPQKPTKAEAQDALNDIRKRFQETGGSDFSQWKKSGSDEIIYDLERGPGGYDPTTGQSVGGGFEDRSDVANLRKRFEAMPGLDAEELEEAMAFYETYRQGKDPAKRWDISHNAESPAQLLEAKKEEEAAPTYDAEGNPKKAAKKQSEQKRLIEAWKNNFSGDVGVADVPKKAERYKESIESARADFVKDPRVGQILAADSQLEVADETTRIHAERVAAAPGYAAATAKVAGVQAKQETAAKAIDGQVDAKIDPKLKSDATAAEGTLKTNRATTKSKLAALPATSFGKDEKEQSARKAGYEKLLDRMQKADSVDEFDHYKKIWDEAVKDQPALKDAKDLNDAFTAERASLETFGTAQGALKQADATARAEIMATADGQSLAALDAELATAKSERDVARKGLYERDAAALDAAAGDDAKTKAELATINAEDEALKKSIAEARVTRARLAAETDYDEKEAEYQEKIGAYNALLTATEQGDPQATNAAWERLSGKKFPKELGLDDVTEKGLKARTDFVDAQAGLTTAEKNKIIAENDIIRENIKMREDKRKAAGEAVSALNTVALKPASETAESAKGIFEAGTGSIEAYQKASVARQSKEQEGIRESLATLQKGLAEDVAARRGELRKAGTIENLWKLGHPEKGEQTATQKAAHDRAYSEENTKQRLENRDKRLAVSQGMRTAEAESEAKEAEAKKLEAEAMAKWYKENPKYG